MRRAIMLLVTLAFATSTFAPSAFAEKRVALVIGNGAYVNATPLPNPRNDAEDVAAALKEMGFETSLGIDLDKAGLDDATINFSRAARSADVALFFITAGTPCSSEASTI